MYVSSICNNYSGSQRILWKSAVNHHQRYINDSYVLCCVVMVMLTIQYLMCRTQQILLPRLHQIPQEKWL